MIKALTYAEASLVSPFLYAQLLVAIALGYLWFGDFPDRWTLGGAVVVIGSGLYLTAGVRRGKS